MTTINFDVDGREVAIEVWYPAANNHRGEDFESRIDLEVAENQGAATA